MARKTKDERAADHRRRELDHWPVFEAAARAVQTLTEAEQLQGAVPEGSPGRRFYSNFGTWLVGGVLPEGASAPELRLYAELAERLEGQGFKPGWGAKVRAEVEARIAAGGLPHL